LAFSMSFLISGVMLNRSFLGMGRGTMGDRTSSGFLLQMTLGSQAHPGEWGEKQGSLKLEGLVQGHFLGLIF
jgi:hypothetical protein